MDSKRVLTETATLEGNNVQFATIKNIFMRAHSVQPAKDTKSSRVASAIVGNDDGCTLLMEGWRGNADRLEKLLKPNEIYTIMSVKVRQLDDGELKYNETTLPFKVLFDASSTVVKK